MSLPSVDAREFVPGTRVRVLDRIMGHDPTGLVQGSLRNSYGRESGTVTLDESPSTVLLRLDMHCDDPRDLRFQKVELEILDF